VRRDPGPGRLPAIDPAEQPRTHDDEIAEFYAAHRGAVRGFLIAAGCAESEADDVVQDTILAVRTRWEWVRTLDKPAAYWFKAASRRFRRVQGQRDLRLARGDPQAYLMAVPDPADGPAVIDAHDALMALLRELPPRQRQVFWLRKAARFSEAETAEILDIRPGTVKSQLHDAKARIDELLRAHGDIWAAGVEC
jgi:RNA polymerase sigma factor (sigma-70 family)